MKRTRHAMLASVFVLMTLAASGPAQDNVWTSHGPNDIGWINDLAIADSTGYAATPNGVFRSEDGGVTWQAAGLTGQSVFKIEARHGTDAVFAAVQGAASSTNLYVSRDSGLTWTGVSGLDWAQVIGIDPERPSTAYVGTSDAGIWKSADAGANWQKVSTLPGNEPALGLAFNSNAIYVFTYDTLYKSSDGGSTWTDVRPPSGGLPGSVAAGRANGALYASAGNSFCRSSDSAATWTCSVVTPDSVSGILEVAANGGGPPRLLVASTTGLLLSSDGGTTWTPAGGDLSSAYSPALASDASGSLVLAGTQTQVFSSHDRGDSWAISGAGLKAVWVGALALDRHNPSTVWAGGYSADAHGPGLFESIDAGLSWSQAAGPVPAPSILAIAIDPADPATMYVSGSTLFKTRDGGQTWAPSGPGPSRLSVLAIDPASPQRVLAGGTALYRSEDGAQTWGAASITQAIFSILFDDRHPGTVYAGSYWDVDFDYNVAVGGSIFISRDHGASFTKGDVRFPSEVLALARDPFRDATLYAGTGLGMFRSDDAGSTWFNSSDGLADPSAAAGPFFDIAVSSIVADPVRPDSLYCGTDYGIFRSTDGTRTWQPLSTGLPRLEVVALVVSPDGQRLHAGTAGGGVFDLDLAAEAATAACVPSTSRLCLVGGRYAVDLIAKGPGRWEPGSAQPLGDRSGYFGLPFATGNPTLPEVVVKMVAEGALGSSAAPVFFSSLTTLPFYLTVTDTLTGNRRAYPSNPGSPLCGAADIPTRAAETSLQQRRTPARGSEQLQLLGGRFSVTLQAHDPGTGQTATGMTMSSGDGFGFFSLPAFTGDPQFPEVVVKMLDAQTINGSFWFFHTGLTSLDYTLTVTDSVTGTIQTYESPGAFCGGADTQAFSALGTWDYATSSNQHPQAR